MLEQLGIGFKEGFELLVQWSCTSPVPSASLGAFFAVGAPYAHARPGEPVPAKHTCHVHGKKDVGRDCEGGTGTGDDVV